MSTPRAPVPAGSRRVLVEVRPKPSVLQGDDAPSALAGNERAAARLAAAGCAIDERWSPVELRSRSPRPWARRAGSAFVAQALTSGVGGVVHRLDATLPFPVPRVPGRPTKVFRATVEDVAHLEQVSEVVAAESGVLGIWADPQVSLTTLEPTAAAVGTAEEVAELLGARALLDAGANGQGVRVAVVDNGVSVDHLRAHGRVHAFDDRASFTTPAAPHAPGAFPPAHGTKVAFQIGLLAPAAMIADHAVLLEPDDDEQDPLMHAWISDITPAYEKLRDLLAGLPLADRRLVISNSWALTRPDFDFPAGDDRNFSDNVDHPFNRLVRETVALGADVLFSAGNCGAPYPASGCGFEDQPICGANALEEVITVGGVDVEGRRTGYSSQGPGRFSLEKPDLCAYTHFAGSGIGHADWGTSVACPVAAGVVAALRSRVSPADVPPRALRDILTRTARRESDGYDLDLGWGIIDPPAALRALGLAP